MKLNLNKIELFIPAALLTVCAAFFLGLAFPHASLADPAPALEEVVDRLQRIYEKTQDFQAGFIQETTVKSIRKTDTETGTVYFKNPRQMLWDYKKPKTKKLIINAQKAWLYLPRDKTVYVQESNKIFKSEALIKFLSGLGKLNQDFTIQFASPTVDQDGNYLLLLYPREKGASYSFLRMTVAKNNFYILQIGFDDVMGNSTLLRFSNIKMNSGLSSKLFQFQPPPGVSIFKMP
ncbi:MAG: outer membrane lipoprotein carrier protein LolA [Smithellaceae bacterium]|jgi:outer membrane lipoprotein-sorting protein|nr:outer membrane lipoprotein carrier protein LolA [Smithellaceae bacterium]